MDTIANQAADWFMSLKTDPHRQGEFAAWLRASPRHVEEFLLVTAAWRTLDGVTLDKVLERGADLPPSADIVALPVEQSHPSRHLRARPRRWWMASAAAAMVCAGAGILTWAYSTGWLGGEHYTTSIGEIRSFELQDRSVVHLNTHSEMAVRYSAQAREVELREGEALFKVARDLSRPFRVRTDQVTIQALGTEFNVYRQAQGTVVSVIEGRVRVSRRDNGETVEIGAGERIDVLPSRLSTPVEMSDPAQVISWRNRRLLFKNDALAKVTAEFNRYNRALRLRVEGDTAGRTQLTGIFDAGDPESLLLFLSDVPELAIERRDGEAVIRSR